MALYETNICASTADLLDKLAIFAAANGWTVDLNTISTYRRVHLHKGSYHFEFNQSDAGTVFCCCCTGYNSGSAWNAQPDTSASFAYFNITTTGPYTLVSTATALWIYRYSTVYTTQSWAGFGWINDKAGDWSGGQFSLGALGNSSDFFNFSSVGSRAFYFDGAWYVSVVAGGLIGNVVARGSALTIRQPCTYHAGIVPIPVKAFRKDISNTSLFRPLGLVPGVFHCWCGDVYVPGDVITISGSEYLLMPGDSSTYASGTPEFAFKIGS